MPQYNGVWTLEAQAQAQSNQQWVTDPNFKNTTLLLQADNVNGYATNNLFLDGSTNNNNVVRPTGTNATQGSFSPFSQAPGYWGNYFGGASDFLTGASNAALVFGTGTYTIEMWVYQTARSGTQFILGGGGGFQLGINSTGFLFGSVAGVGDLTAATIAVSLNTWTHVAVVRNSTSSGGVAYYINGAAAGTATDATNYTSNVTLNVGTTNGNTGVTPLSGYLSNVRVVKGTNVYTSAFTPSTVPLTAITNTSLLTCQSNRFVDNSTNALALSTSGSPSVQAFGPFAPALQWTPTVVGGSTYMDGTGDLLSIPSTTSLVFGTGIFTIQCWVYRSVAGAVHTIAAKGVSATPNGWVFQINASNQLIFIDTATTIATTTTTIPAGTWTHVAVVRAGTGTNQTTLYINGVSSATGTSAGNFSQSSILYIGADRATANTFNGYISGLEMVKGTALTISVPTAPPTTANSPSLLLNFTNAGIYDGKMANNLETVGNAQVSTSVVKYGSGSMYFPATNGNYCIGAPNQPSLIFGTGNFTIEAWVFPTAFTNTAAGAFGYGVSGGSVDWNLEINTSGTVLYIDNNTGRFSSSSNLLTNTWTHLCVVRTNTGVTMYFNGVSVGSYSTINNISGTSNARLYVGTGAQVPASRQFIGYIDDLRVTNGVARYYTNFTPPQQALPRQ